MKSTKSLWKLLEICLFMGFSGCSMFGLSNSTAPYLIKGELELEENSMDYEVAGLNFYLLNRADKEIKSFTVVFYLFDEDGNPPAVGRSNVAIEVKLVVPEKSSVSGIVSIDDYLYVIPQEGYQIDFLYVSKINYSDGSSWDDPFGMYAF